MNNWDFKETLRPHKYIWIFGTGQRCHILNVIEGVMKAAEQSDSAFAQTALLRNTIAGEMKIDLLRANWYAERYTSGLIADGEGWNFQAVKYLMKFEFSTDGIFSVDLNEKKREKSFKDNLINPLEQ